MYSYLFIFSFFGKIPQLHQASQFGSPKAEWLCIGLLTVTKLTEVGSRGSESGSRNGVVDGSPVAYALDAQDLNITVLQAKSDSRWVDAGIRCYLLN